MIRSMENGAKQQTVERSFEWEKRIKNAYFCWEKFDMLGLSTCYFGQNESRRRTTETERWEAWQWQPHDFSACISMLLPFTKLSQYRASIKSISSASISTPKCHHSVCVCVCGSLTGVRKQIPFRILKFQTKFCLNIWLYNAADKSFSFPISHIIQIDIDSSTATSMWTTAKAPNRSKLLSIQMGLGWGKALRE